MKQWLKYCEEWLTFQYQHILGLTLSGDPIRLRWLTGDSLTKEVSKDEALGLVIEDADIGWLLFLVLYEPALLERQVNQILGLRSRLLREANYTENEKAGEKEDPDSSWRVGIVWLVAEANWDDWQRHILELRRESGAAEEISFDAVRVEKDNINSALDAHGLPRLLLHTRALMAQSATEAETWLSADVQVSAVLEKFSQKFDAPRTRAFARELEEKAKSFRPLETHQFSAEARQFRRFRVKHFRNLNTLEIVADHAEDCTAQAIILFGPNGTGKSSFAEALSLAAFETSPRLEQFLNDKDLARPAAENYLKDYLTPQSSFTKLNAGPRFAWDKGDKYEDTPFALNPNEESKYRFEGVVLNQEDSLKFTELSRQELAARVLRGYSGLADHLSAWLAQEEKRTNEIKLAFTRKHGLSGVTKLSATAYKGLAQRLLQEQLQHPSPEFLDWLRFLGRLSDEDGRHASKLVTDWTNQQTNVVVSRLAETVAKLQEKQASQSQIGQVIREKIDEFDGLAKESGVFRQRLENRIVTLREKLNEALEQMETWGLWLASQSTTPVVQEADTQLLIVEIESLAQERAELEKNGKTLRGRLDLLDQSKQFLVNHWSALYPDTCPVCDSDVSKRQGIEAVVSVLQEESNATIQTLRTRHVEIQTRQKNLDAKLRAAGLSTCPLAAEDQAHLKDWLKPFLPEGAALEDWLINPIRREQLKADLSRMRILPEAPKPYADAALESDRLTSDFISLTQEADRALEDPQSIGEVKKEYEQRLEKVLKDHIPSTLGKVWQEVALVMTTASWLLPNRPTLKLEQRGKALSVQTVAGGRYIRYIFNAAERHVLGLAWFITYYLAKRRFEEAWMLLDDPAQEMDQPSFRELVRLCETLLRLHKRKARPFTLIITLNQEGRALDATRSTNGRLYLLGWQKEQEDSSIRPSVKKVVLLAPGFHPLKPEKMFG